MLASRRQSKLKTLLFNEKVITIVGLLVLVFIGMPLIKNFNRRQKVDGEIRQLETEISQVENQNSDLQKLIKYLQSDEFVEEQARLKLGMKKEGEGVAIVSGKTADTGGSPGSSTPGKNIFSIPGLADAGTAEASSNPRRWRVYFFKR